MKNLSRKIFLGSFTSLVALTCGLATAEEMVTAPSFEGGVTASIGTFYAVPSVDSTAYLVGIDDVDNIVYYDIFNAETEYDFGWEGSIGYIFEDTANGIEVFYRGFDGHKKTAPNNGISDGILYDNVRDSVRNNLNAIDLMISQYLDIGTHVQMRFSGGITYAEIEQKQTVTGENDGTSLDAEQKSKFDGLGPRLSMDARYDFGEELAGFGIVGGASLAFYLGDTDLTATITDTFAEDEFPTISTQTADSINNSAVTNLRGNLGIDYVYFFDDEETTLGLELGYMVDYYDDGISYFGVISPPTEEGDLTITKGTQTSAVAAQDAITFSGPYLLVKGVF